MAFFKTQEKLDEAMYVRHLKISAKYKRFCGSYLEAWHKLLDWYEYQLKNIGR